MMKTIGKAIVTLGIRDVRAAGSVEDAIVAWSEQSEDTSSGIHGWAPPTEDGRAQMAIEGGAMHYIDCDDGRLISAIPVQLVSGDGEDAVYEDGDGDEVDPADVIRDCGGGYSVLGDWSDESVVRLECPDIADAVEHPDTVAMMVRAVIDTHDAMSDRASWAKLVRSIRDAAESLDGIDADDLDD
jgi:hypothetical protein